MRDAEGVRVGRTFREPGLYREYLVERSYKIKADDGRDIWSSFVAEPQFRPVPKREIRTWVLVVVALFVGLLVVIAAQAETSGRLKDTLESRPTWAVVSQAEDRSLANGTVAGYRLGYLDGIKGKEPVKAFDPDYELAQAWQQSIAARDCAAGIEQACPFA